jgi:hypothetical protein
VKNYLPKVCVKLTTTKIISEGGLSFSDGNWVLSDSSIRVNGLFYLIETGLADQGQFIVWAWAWAWA